MTNAARISVPLGVFTKRFRIVPLSENTKRGGSLQKFVSIWAIDMAVASPCSEIHIKFVDFFCHQFASFLQEGIKLIHA